jgi:hypothetical protein
VLKLAPRPSTQPAILSIVNKLDLARSLAKKSHRSQAKAADAVDSLVYELLKDLKRPPSAPRGKKNVAAAVAVPKAKP